MKRDEFDVAEEIRDEFNRASSKFPDMNSAHEGYAILLEEVDELWYEIKHGTTDKARVEAVQVGAMAMRIILNCYPVEEGE